MDSILCAENIKVQSARNLVKDPPKVWIHDLQLGPSADSILDFCLSLFLFKGLSLPHSQVLLSSSLAHPVFLIAFCPLTETQWGETGTQEVFLLLVFNFLLEFLLDDIDF